MHIAMIDPSLFTVPYDRALIGGLVHAGHTVTLHGRPPGVSDNELGNVDLAPDFYRIASRKALTRLPKTVRLGIKGVDHIISMFRLRSRLGSERPDIIHFQWLSLPVFDRHLLPKFREIAPLILTVHDTNPFNGDPSAALQARGFSECLSAFDHVIVHTQQGRDRLLALGVAETRLSVLPHGMLEDLPPLPNPHITSGPMTFLLFGKIKPYKGADVMIEAFARLPFLLRNQATLKIIGKAYMPLESLRQLAQSRGISDKLLIDERFVGDQEISSLFSPDVVAVFPYREIEASGVLPFALGNGRPIIASALGNFAETLQDGCQGLLVPPDDPEALSVAMARMISDRSFAVKCGLEARSLAENAPEWSGIAEETLKIYRLADRQDLPRSEGTVS